MWVTSIGGTPPEILANDELAKLFLPALKADLCIVENYRWVFENIQTNRQTFTSVKTSTYVA